LRKKEDRYSKNEDKYDVNYLLGNSDNFKIELEIENTESDAGKNKKFGRNF